MEILVDICFYISRLVTGASGTVVYHEDLRAWHYVDWRERRRLLYKSSPALFINRRETKQDPDQCGSQVSFMRTEIMEYPEASI